MIQKGISYLNAFPYVIWEMQDAINDCRDGELARNDNSGRNYGNSVYAWDEAVAFYTGSIEGTSIGGVGDLSGKMQYYLANKRCENFGTCTADTDGNAWEGRSKINKEIFDLFKKGQEQLIAAAALVNAGSSTGTALRCRATHPRKDRHQDARSFHSRYDALPLQNEECSARKGSRRAFCFRFGRPSFHRRRRSSRRRYVVSSRLGSRLYRCGRIRTIKLKQPSRERTQNWAWAPGSARFHAQTSVISVRRPRPWPPVRRLDVELEREQPRPRLRHRDSPGRHRAHRRDIRRGHVPKERITQQARRRVNRAAARRSRSRVGEARVELSEPPTRALPRDFLLHINQSINQSILF